MGTAGGTMVVCSERYVVRSERYVVRSERYVVRSGMAMRAAVG